MTRLVEFLGLRRNTALLLVALLLAGTGERLWLGFAPKYLETLGASVLLIGLFDGLQTLLGALYAWPGGWLTDRWGARRSLLVFAGISILGYGLVLAWPHWLALFLGACLFLAWSALSLPATFSVVAQTLEARHHTMGVGVQSMIRRVPMMLGPLLGGWLIVRYGWARGVPCALVGCMVLAGLSALAVAAFAPDRPGGAAPDRAGLLAVLRAFSPELRELLVSDILIRFCERIPYAFVILWAMNHGGVDARQFGLLVAIEMTTAMVCYIPVAHLADRHGRRPFVLATFVFFTLFPLTLLGADTFFGLAAAFAVRGLKEFGEPARKALIIAAAPPERRARSYGAYYLVRDTVVTSGSLLGAALWSLGPRWNFLGAALCGAAGTLWFWLRVCRRPATTAGQTAARPLG